MIGGNIIRSVISAKQGVESGLQAFGSRWAAHTAKVQSRIKSGITRVDG